MERGHEWDSIPGTAHGVHLEHFSPCFNMEAALRQPDPEAGDYRHRSASWFMKERRAMPPTSEQDLIRVCKKHRVYFHEDCDVCNLLAGPATSEQKLRELCWRIMAEWYYDTTIEKLKFASTDPTNDNASEILKEFGELETILRSALLAGPAEDKK